MKTSLFHIAIILIIGFVSKLNNPSLAQTTLTGTITGRITDAASMEPIATANIVVLGTAMGAASDLNGEFVIPGVLPGTYTVEITHLGHETLLRTDVVVYSAKPAVVNGLLTPASLVEDVVTVSPSPFNRQLRSGISTTQLQKEEIRRFPGGFEDVVRTVSTLPGVAVVNTGGRNDLLVRGGGPSENLYVVNGMEVPNINHFGSQGSSSGSLSFINLDFIEEVEFSAGGFSAEYGDKMSSVLGIRMRRGRTDRIGGTLTISATQFGADAEGPLSDRGGYIISARRSYLDFIFKAAGQPFIPVYNDINLFVTYDITPKDRFFLLGLAAFDRVERDQGDEEARIINAGIMDNSQNQFVTGIKYQRLFGMGFVDIILNRNQNDFRFSQADKNLLQYFASDASEIETNVKLQSRFSLNNTTYIKTGILIKHIEIDNETMFADSIYNRSGIKVPRETLTLPSLLRQQSTFYKYGIFSDIQRDLSSRMTVNFGIRGDYFEYIEKSFYYAPRVSLRYRITQRSDLKMSLGRYNQSPSYVWTINPVNHNLTALRNDMVVFGWDYFPRDDVKFGMETYYKKYSNLPAGSTPETDYLVLTNTGVGYGGRSDDFQSFGFLPLSSSATGNSYGLELQAQKKMVRDRIYGQVALSLSRSRFNAPNGKIYPGQFDQAIIFQVSGGYKPNPRWEYSAKFRVWTGAPYTPVYRPADNNGSIQNLPEEYLSRRLRPGHHLDLRLNHYIDCCYATWLLFIDIQNVYNYKMETSPTYDFWNDRVKSWAPIGILPSIGVTLII